MTGAQRRVVAELDRAATRARPRLGMVGPVPDLHAQEIADLVGLPLRRTLQVLAQLHNLGHVHRRADGPFPLADDDPHVTWTTRRP